VRELTAIPSESTDVEKRKHGRLITSSHILPAVCIEVDGSAHGKYAPPAPVFLKRRRVYLRSGPVRHHTEIDPKHTKTFIT